MAGLGPTCGKARPCQDFPSCNFGFRINVSARLTAPFEKSAQTTLVTAGKALQSLREQPRSSVFRFAALCAFNSDSTLRGSYNTLHFPSPRLFFSSFVSTARPSTCTLSHARNPNFLSVFDLYCSLWPRFSSGIFCRISTAFILWT